MRKVLAKLTTEELDKLEQLHSRISTYMSLLQNVFISSEDKIIVSEELPLLEQKLNELTEELIKKYRIPKSVSNDMKVSYNDSEIYLELNT